MIEAIYRTKTKSNADATRMRTVVAIAKYLRGRTGVFSSGQRSWPLVNTPVLPRKYLAIATTVRMRVAPVLTSFSFYILLQSPITGVAVVAAALAFALLGLLVRIY